MKKKRKTRKEKVFAKTFEWLLCSVIMVGFVGEVSGSDSHLTFTVYATRGGFVGETTVNGHVIEPNDHFVALPSGKALCSNGGHEYEVRVTYQGKSIVAPVWDISPWNTKDDYWNPSSKREMWQDLPQGMPEAQAAYQNNYNDGKDQFGRTVTNPAGIDLADGTFWNDLEMTDNDWVTVEFLWVITDVNGLQAMSDNLGGWYELGNDIDASATSTWNSGAGFIPIGDDPDPFRGHFDGKGHTIADLYINRTDYWHVGLFGYTSEASEIKNAALLNVNITGENCVGSLVGVNYRSIIENCYSTGTVTGSRATAGLVGWNYGTLTDCYFKGTVENESGYYTGGLVAYNQGLIGPPVTITNCYAAGDVRGGAYAGGLTGSNSGVTIHNCYSTANVFAEGYNIGGLVGLNSYSTITNCYSIGSVGPGVDYVGGLVGRNEYSECNDCFWDIETSGQATSACGTGKTTAEMKQQATFTNWDFVNIWDVDESVVYPFLIYFNKILITAHGPVDLIVTDPDSLGISKQLNQIPGATYLECDLNGDGELDDIVTVPKKIGNYLIQVVPEPDVPPTDTYSLEAAIYDQTMVLAEDVQIQDIPPEPYEFKSKLCYSDFDDSNDVGIVDFAILSSQWLVEDCDYPSWCEGTDLNYNGSIDLIDFAIFAEHWLWPKIGTPPEEDPNEPPLVEDPNIIYEIVDINDSNEITMNINESIRLYVRMTTADDVDIFSFQLEVDISDPNLGSIDNTEYPNGTAEILASPRESTWDDWGPGWQQEEGIVLSGLSAFSGPMSDGNMASFMFTCTGEGDLALELINLDSSITPTLRDITIHQVDPNP